MKYLLLFLCFIHVSCSVQPSKDYAQQNINLKPMMAPVNTLLLPDTIEKAYPNLNREERMILKSRVNRLAKSVCLITSEDNLVNNQPQTKPYGYIHSLKEDEPFWNIPSIIKNGEFRNATGFLIGENRILTAQHIIKGKTEIERNKYMKKLRIIFNYKLSIYDPSRASWVSSKDVYEVKRIVVQGQGRSLINQKADWCILELDRIVEPKLKLEISGEKLSIGQKLIMIGHPAGMPLTGALKGKILRKPSLFTKQAYYCSLDSFHGNSGSPIFMYPSLELIGLYVAGKPKDIDARELTVSKDPSKMKQSFIGIEQLKDQVNMP